MATFISTNLDHEIKGKFVEFQLGIKAHLEPKEVNHRWLLQIEFWEKDPLKDDRLIPVPRSVAFGEVDAGKWRIYIDPSKPDIDRSYKVEFPEQHVNTEPGKEEVYAIVQLKPLEAPPGLVPAKSITNITHVKV